MSDLKKWKIAILPMLFMLCMLFSVKVEAAGITATPIALDDLWVSGEISTKGEVDFYKFTTRKAGWVKVTYQADDIGSSSVGVLNQDRSKSYWSENVYSSSSIDPKTVSSTKALEPGTYYIKVSGRYAENVGNYRVKVAFESAGNNEEGSNNDDFRVAKSLGMGQSVTGFLSEDDRVDFFRITVPSRKRIRLIFTSYFSTACMGIWDNDRIQLKENRVYSASKTNPQTYVYEETLNPGTYFVKIYPYYNQTGKYVLKYTEKILTQKITISGKKEVVAGSSFTLKASVSPSNTTDKTIRWSSGDTSLAWVDSKGKVTTYSKCGTVKITASAQDESNKTKVYTIVIKPKKLPQPYVSNFYGRKLYVSWNWSYGASGYEVQYAKNSKFNKAVTKKISKNKTSVTISRMSKQKYYVRVRAYYKKGKKTYYGSWSSRNSVRISR